MPACLDADPRRPLVGGFLANPVPRLLPPSWTLFEQYPYLLPAIVSGSTGIIAFISGLFLTPEVSVASSGDSPCLLLAGSRLA